MHAHLAALAENDFVRILAFTTPTDAAKRVLHRTGLDERIAHVRPGELASVKLRLLFLAFGAETLHAPPSASPSFFVLGRLFLGSSLRVARFLFRRKLLLNLAQERLNKLSVHVRRPRQDGLRSVNFSDDFIIGCDLEHIRPRFDACELVLHDFNRIRKLSLIHI